MKTPLSLGRGMLMTTRVGAPGRAVVARGAGRGEVGRSAQVRDGKERRFALPGHSEDDRMRMAGTLAPNTMFTSAPVFAVERHCGPIRPRGPSRTRHRKSSGDR
jgi:hypothetical protein